MSADGLVNEICADIAERLEGIECGFALVIWLDGRPGDIKAVCVAGGPQTEHQAQIGTALATGIRVIGKP
jgi:hypothetical protein